MNLVGGLFFGLAGGMGWAGQGKVQARGRGDRLSESLMLLLSLFWIGRKSIDLREELLRLLAAEPWTASCKGRPYRRRASR